MIGVAVFGSVVALGTLALAWGLADLGGSHGVLDQALALGAIAVLAFFLFAVLLVQMVRGNPIALGCGGLVGVFAAAVGFAWAAFNQNPSDDLIVVFAFVAAVGATALAIGAGLRLIARAA